jgi:hypothetical protein
MANGLTRSAAKNRRPLKFENQLERKQNTPGCGEQPGVFFILD